MKVLFDTSVLVPALIVSDKMEKIVLPHCQGYE